MRRLFVICACTWIISTSAEGKLFDACNTTVWFRVSAHICSEQFFEKTLVPQIFDQIQENVSPERSGIIYLMSSINYPPEHAT